MNAFLSEERTKNNNGNNASDELSSSSSGIEASSSAQDGISGGAGGSSSSNGGGAAATGSGGRAARIKTYTVVPLSPEVGVMEWVQNTIPIGNYLTDKSRSSPGAHSRYYEYLPIVVHS